jgi:hypothetical protein
MHPPTKLGIAIGYDGWQVLLREFIDEVAGPDADLKVTMEWTMEAWLQRLKRQQEETNGQEEHAS